jgi:hypothetical protein
MRTLVYTRTHKGDPDKTGCFGIWDCMGKLRRFPGLYEAKREDRRCPRAKSTHQSCSIPSRRIVTHMWDIGF